MVKYPDIKAVAKKTVSYDTFLSVDYSRASANLKDYFSPDSVNMIRDEYGKVRRRMGYFKIMEFSRHIYGMTKWQDGYLIHGEKNLYFAKPAASEEEEQQEELLYNLMSERPSQFFHWDGKVYILDGDHYLVYDGETCAPVVGRIPRVMIGGTPAGGGTQFEQFNLLQDKWEQSFRGTATDKVYQLAQTGLDSTPVVVKKARLSGNDVVWDTLTENTDFTVNRTAGKITFNTAPGEPVLDQEDNIIITASKNGQAGRNRILNCTVGLAFGMNGEENQWFLTGNPDYPNELYWCEAGDPTFFGDLQFAVLGQDDSAIVSLSSLNTYIVAHKDRASGRSYVCGASYQEINELLVPQVTVAKVLTGCGCIAPYASQSMGEPLFLTDTGIQTITNKELTSEEMTTSRGERINRRLLTEPGLEHAVSCVFGYYYLLAVNGNVYVLDRLNPMEESTTLNNNYQYNAFFWNHIPAVAFLVDGDRLLFGTDDGEVMEFYTDEDNSASYSDNGEGYQWRWEFPEYTGSTFYTNKSIKYVALRAKAYARTTVAIDVQIAGQWYQVLEENLAFGFLDLSDLDLSALNLSTDATPKKIAQRYSERKLDKLAFRIRGEENMQPFGLYSFAFEVREKGRHKG